MPTNIYRGDAPPRPQVLLVGPPASDQLTGRFAFTINGKTLVAEGWSASSIVTAWQELTLPEFVEITPSVASGDDYAAGAILLTGPADGTPFDVTVEGTAVVKIETVTAGSAPRNEIQQVTVPAAIGGTFTLTFNGQTTAGIAYNAAAATLQAALEALSNIAPGDVAVTGFSAGPWSVEFKGTYAGIEVAEMTLDTSGLTGSTSISVSTTTEGTAAENGNIGLSVWEIAIFGFTDGPSTSVTPSTNAASIKSFLDGATGAVWTVTGDANHFACTSAGPPTVTLGTPYIASSSTPPSEFPGNVSGTAGTPAFNETQRIDLTATGGTFTLTFDGETTAAIAYNAAASAVKSALEALTNITSVSVVGLPGSAYSVTFTNPGSQNVVEMTADGSALTAVPAGGSVAETVAHDPGTQEQQRITIPESVIGGTFVLVYQSDRTAAIAYDATAATIDTAIEAAIETIGVGGVAVDGPAGGPWLITFTPKRDSTLLEADSTELVVGEASLVVVQQAPGGPTHWSDPHNWTLARPPESGDSVWLDQPGLNITHSLRQRTGFTLGDATVDTLKADGAMHFVADQKVTLRTTGTLPGGLTVGDYYVVDPDIANLTFKLSATRGGTVVDLTTATGTGTHTAVVELDAPAGTAIFNPTARFSGRLGLPRRNASDYWEYRPLSLAIGVKASGSKQVRIGAGDGPGSGRLKLDLGADAAEVRIIQTGGSAEGSVPACLIVVNNDATEFVQLDGDSGLAYFPEDETTIGSLDVRGGTLSTGDNVTIVGDVVARVGSVRGRYLDASGNSHRWE